MKNLFVILVIISSFSVCQSTVFILSKNICASSLKTSLLLLLFSFYFFKITYIPYAHLFDKITKMKLWKSKKSSSCVPGKFASSKNEDKLTSSTSTTPSTTISGMYSALKHFFFFFWIYSDYITLTFKQKQDNETRTGDKLTRSIKSHTTQ